MDAPRELMGKVQNLTTRIEFGTDKSPYGVEEYGKNQ